MPAEMTSRERLLTTIRHEEPDRVPNSPRIWAWMIEYLGGMSWLDEIRMHEEFGVDILTDIHLGVPDYIYNPLAGDYRELPDVKVDMKIDGTPETRIEIERTVHTPAGNLHEIVLYARPGGFAGVSPTVERSEHMLKKPDDLAKLKYLLPDPAYARPLNVRERIKCLDGRGLVTVRPGWGVDHLMCDSMGVSNIMIALYDNREMVEAALELFHSYYLKLLRHCLEEGAEVIFDSWYNFSLSTGWPPQIWRELFKPRIKQNIDLIHEYGAIHHFYDDGNIMPILDDLGELGVDILATLCPPPVGDVDLAEVKRRIGDRVCIRGNVDLLYVIMKGTPETIREKVRETIEIAAPGGGFILSTSDSIREGTPYENVKAYFDAGREFGAYPIGR